MPEILIISLVLKLKILNNKSGNETIKCATKKSGFSFLIKLANL